jgi:BirA family biotin operon repressor/biotin-[acetyl-CoA-carboxylase] ligase
MTIGSNLFFVENLPSTNIHAVSLIKKGRIPDGAIIYTNFQSAGKGQWGNYWESESGKNLLFSVILFPQHIKPDNQFIISIAFSLGICDFLKRYISACSIKWPNDIYVHNDKIAGMLIENSIMANKIESVVAGIGLNINQEQFLSDAPNPVSLAQLTGENYDTDLCIKQLASDLDERYKQISAEKQNQIKSEYIAQLFRFMEWHDYRDQTGAFTGCIKSVEDDGRLVIERRSGNVSSYSFKEVYFIL